MFFPESTTGEHLSNDNVCLANHCALRDHYRFGFASEVLFLGFSTGSNCPTDCLTGLVAMIKQSRISPPVACFLSPLSASTTNHLWLCQLCPVSMPIQH